ncbi:MAG: PQQ-dependent sugar dehydrogenase [Nanoarchaeota archaeon]
MNFKGEVQILILLIFLINIVNAQTVPPIILQRITGGLQDPLYVTHDGTGNGILYTVQQNGIIKKVINGVIQSVPFLDIGGQICYSSGGETGLLGLAFHPNFASNGFLYIYYTDLNGDVIVKRYTASGNPPVVNIISGIQILFIDHPPAGCGGTHNGGMIEFGPDGYLYIAVGNGGFSNPGSSSDPAINLNSLLGKILRIDVNGGSPYLIPLTNPFINTPGALPEIWAYGLRNPWRFSFDSLTGDIYIGDVGNFDQEEIDYQPSISNGGEHYGWPWTEGCFNPASFPAYTPPIYCYSHNPFGAVMGGYIYRGSQYPEMYGRYYFGDYSQDKIWSITPPTIPGGSWSTTEQLTLNDPNGVFAITSFGEGPNGEIYLTSRNSANVYSGEIYNVKATKSIINMPSSASLGQTITIQMSDPLHPGKVYILVKSAFTHPSMQIPGGITLLLADDGFYFLLSLFYPNVMGLINSQGILDSLGQATAIWNIPNNPLVGGSDHYFAFVTYDPSTQSVIAVSAPYQITIT